MGNKWKWIVLGAATASAVLLVGRKTTVKPIEELRVRITASTEIPDPANIVSTGDWYYLDHISSGLVAYDNEKRQFSALYSEAWTSTKDGLHIFKLRPGIKFHDGTPITAKDVIWSIKRHLILKTSTHFPLWEYILGCEGLRTLNDECPGLQARSSNEIALHLKGQSDSFFLQLASPENGIWAAADMDPITLKIQPTKFSGPYFLESRTDSFALLRRNENSPLSQKFPNSPRSIRIKIIPLAQLDQAILAGEVDIATRFYNPFGEKDWKAHGISMDSTTPSTMIYLFGLGTGKHPPIGRDFMEAAWRINRDPVLLPAETFLPFERSYSLTKAEFLAQLPDKTAPRIRVFCPEGLFTKGLLDQLQEAAHTVGSTLEFSFAKPADWFLAFNDSKAAEKYDYILSAYAASERYPAVQLRYLTKKLIKPEIDLKKAEVPDLGEDAARILKAYQAWLLEVRQAIPIYLNVTVFIHPKKIDIGGQSMTDAEIELWRVTFQQVANRHLPR